MTDTRKPVPRWYMISAVVAILWNLLGVSAFAMQMMLSPEMLAQLPAPERELIESTPVWATAAFALAVIGGLLGSIGLAVRKRWALLFLWLSLLGIVVQNVHGFFMSDALAVYGPQAAVMPALVIVIAVLLVLMARNANSRHWLD
jgi:hypothetical protein